MSGMAQRSDTADVHVVGGGLAGTEAARLLAARGLRVDLHEMRPVRPTAAHATGDLAELVCSNSLGSLEPSTGKGLLLAEMERMGSLVVASARRHAVPAGASLAVDREGFAATVTAAIEAEPRIRVRREEVTALPGPDGPPTIVATGPLTAPALSRAILETTGEDSLYFYDAIAPIVLAESLDRDVVYGKSRYNRGTPDFLNCPLDEARYEAFVDALLAGETVPTKDFEQAAYFEGCMPIEELARRGRRTLAFGPMRPVGLEDPRTGRRPHAVVQLRREDRHGQLYNLVGFQTKLRYPEQTRIFRRIPGLEQARFVRLGSVHRNTFVNAPRLLGPDLSLRVIPHVWLAGQMTGVEGYAESAALGMVAALAVLARRAGRAFEPPPETTALGGILAYLREADPAHFQPMNVNFGLMPPLARPPRGKRERRRALAERASREHERWWDAVRDRCEPITHPITAR